MKYIICVLLISALISCGTGNQENSIDIHGLESEIINQTIEELCPKIPEIRLVVPAAGGEESSKYEARKKTFWSKHNNIRINDDAYFILSSKLTVPSTGERYLTQNGIPKGLTKFLYSAKVKSSNYTTTKRLFGILVKNMAIQAEDYKSLNQPGCYGYLEYSRILFSENYNQAQFIFKYRLNHGMDFTQVVSVKKTENRWRIENKEDILVSYEHPNSPIEPTHVIDTIYVPAYDDDSFQITFSTDLNAESLLPRKKEITVTIKQNAFDAAFMKYVDFEFSIDRSSNDLAHIDFTKINDTIYTIKIDDCYSKPYIEYDVGLTPKRGYILNEFLAASQSYRIIDHTSPASLVVWIDFVDQKGKLNCK